MQLTLQEAARYLGKSERQLRYLIQTGKLPSRKIKGRHYIDKNELPLSSGQAKAARQKAKSFQKLTSEVIGEDAAQAIDKNYSVRNLRVFEIGREIYLELAKVRGANDPATAALQAGMLAISIMDPIIETRS
ncbi:Helix-turn-helix domain-containing protein [Sulfidibacter corallicola]|uniref:Helix-turn-helix domain-containing protein n=1 Tax=Sulfidibacter corallicola TaxID=2818388 RepID=A0A8A4TWL7_SULCO|nr:helix-turn-helix domain-containing protein [Sulfidibacter corallicola]QTD50915.1 helix-turn-helix domain-containing protein [Sulfidibacter corallicola]